MTELSPTARLDISKHAKLAMVFFQVRPPPHNTDYPTQTWP